MSSTKPATVCPGPINRRSFMRIGALSMGALAGGASTDLAGLLAAEAAAPRKADKEFSVILLWAAGGPSHLETFDMKPNAPQEYRGVFKPIKTNVPGVEITELLPNLAKMADKFSLVRSLYHNRNEHSGGTGRMLSGYASVAADPFQSEYPVIGSVVAKHLEDKVRDLPLYVGNSTLYGGGPGYLGHACSAFQFGGDPKSPTFKVGQLSLTPEAAARLHKRKQLLNSFDTLRRDVDGSGTMSMLDKFNQRALEMLTSTRTREAFDLSKEPESVRKAYGPTTGGQSLLLARRLVEAGVRFVQLTAHFPVDKKHGVVGATNWDDHSVNANIFEAYKDRMPLFDVCVPAFLKDLYSRGLDRNVLFIFCGEFGRTPKVSLVSRNAKGPGRDHWCRAMSIFLAGGGLKMGQVVGATNSRGEDPVERVMNSNCLLATIYKRFGVDVSKSYPDKTGRPTPILTDGKPISELL